MRICYVMLHYDPRVACADPAAYLDRVPIHRYLPQATAALGHGADVVHLFPTDIEFAEAGVRHHFVAATPLAHTIAQRIGRLSRRDPVSYELATRTIQRVQAMNPDVIHFHGMTLNWNLFLLLCMLGRSGPPVVLHYHGGYPATRRLGRALQRFNMRRAERLLFTTRAHAVPFVDAGVIEGFERVIEFMELSSHFQPRARAEARQITGMAGDPIFLWAGRLHPIKDPLTALRGFEQIAYVWPDARLYLYYRTGELLPELHAFVSQRPQLRTRIHFQGHASFEQMELIYNSADFLLQASLREFSGAAVLEAMACGVIPVVTNLPSFRKMTGDGRYGILFPPGKADALARGVLRLDRQQLPNLSAAVRQHFEQTLSFPALARQLDAVYRDVARPAQPVA